MPSNRTKFCTVFLFFEYRRNHEEVKQNLHFWHGFSQVIPKKKGAVALWSYADEVYRRNDILPIVKET
jgi:hypothetical protein